MDDLSRKLVGKFIVIDGPDGAGKTTQLKKLREYLGQLGLGVQVATDPGTTSIGQKIRAMLLDRDNGEIGSMCETLLFMASRAQLMYEVISPALTAGVAVLCDRFVSATLAYQGASGVSRDSIMTLAEIAIAGRWPHLTIILDLPAEVGMERIGVLRNRLKGECEDGHQQLPLFGDRMEIRASVYHREVRRIFRDLHRFYPSKVRNVSAAGTEDEVFERILLAISEELASEP